VLHETIYRSLFIQTRGVLKKELMVHLRRDHTMRYGRHHCGKVGMRHDRRCGLDPRATSTSQ
jgi:hypothetical protein